MRGAHSIAWQTVRGGKLVSPLGGPPTLDISSSTMALQRVGGPVWDTRLGLEVVGSPKLAPVAISPPPHPGGHAEPVDVDTMAQSLRECGLLRVVERPSCSDTHITVGVSVQMVSKAGYLWTKPMSQLPSVTFSSGSTQPIAQLVLEQVRLPGRIVQPRPFKLCGVDMFTVQGELISDVVTPAELCWCDPPSAFILRATYRDGVETLKYLGGRVADARVRQQLVDARAQGLATDIQHGNARVRRLLEALVSLTKTVRAQCQAAQPEPSGC